MVKQGSFPSIDSRTRNPMYDKRLRSRHTRRSDENEIQYRLMFDTRSRCDFSDSKTIVFASAALLAARAGVLLDGGRAVRVKALDCLESPRLTLLAVGFAPTARVPGTRQEYPHTS